MPLGPQPHRARGTVDHPNSAVRLRQVLACFGLIACAAGAGLVWRVGARPFAVVLLVGALAALIDLAVVTTRIRRR